MLPPTYLVVPPYQEHQIEVISSSLFIEESETVTIRWKVPVPTMLQSAMVTESELKLYALDINVKQWKLVDYTFPNAVNNTIDVVLVRNDNLYFALKRFTQIVPTVLPIAFRVSWTISANLTEPFKYWSWSGIYYLPVTLSVNRNFRLSIGRMCREPDINADDPIPSCPPTESQATMFISGFEEEVVTSRTVDNKYSQQYYGYFYKAAQACYVQSSSVR